MSMSTTHHGTEIESEYCEQTNGGTIFTTITCSGQGAVEKNDA